MTHFYLPLEHTDSPLLSKEDIEMLFVNRSAVLQSIQSALSPKFYQTLKEKIDAEKQTMMQFCLVEEEKKETLSHYSFVLQPSYFEQKFFGSDE